MNAELAALQTQGSATIAPGRQLAKALTVDAWKLVKRTQRTGKQARSDCRGETLAAPAQGGAAAAPKTRAPTAAHQRLVGAHFKEGVSWTVIYVEWSNEHPEMVDWYFDVDMAAETDLSESDIDELRKAGKLLALLRFRLLRKYALESGTHKNRAINQLIPAQIIDAILPEKKTSPKSAFFDTGNADGGIFSVFPFFQPTKYAKAQKMGLDPFEISTFLSAGATKSRNRNRVICFQSTRNEGVLVVLQKWR